MTMASHVFRSLPTLRIPLNGSPARWHIERHQQAAESCSDPCRSAVASWPPGIWPPGLTTSSETHPGIVVPTARVAAVKASKGVSADDPFFGDPAYKAHRSPEPSPGIVKPIPELPGPSNRDVCLDLAPQHAVAVARAVIFRPDSDMHDPVGLGVDLDEEPGPACLVESCLRSRRRG